MGVVGIECPCRGGQYQSGLLINERCGRVLLPKSLPSPFTYRFGCYLSYPKSLARGQRRPCLLLRFLRLLLSSSSSRHQ